MVMFVTAMVFIQLLVILRLWRKFWSISRIRGLFRCRVNSNLLEFCENLFTKTGDILEGRTLMDDRREKFQ